MPIERLMFAALGDVAGQVRGKGFPVSDRADEICQRRRLDAHQRSNHLLRHHRRQPVRRAWRSHSSPSARRRRSKSPSEATRPTSISFWATSNTPMDAAWECCLRSMARSAVADLESKTGLAVHSAFEHEFIVKDLAESGHSYSLRGFQKGKTLGETLVSALRQAGLTPDSFLREYGERQYEVTVKPAKGVAAADQAMILREAHPRRRRRLRAGGQLHANSLAAFRRERRSRPHEPAPPRRKSGHIRRQTAQASSRPRQEPSSPAFSNMSSAFVAISAPSVISYIRLTPHHWSAAFNNLGYRDREATVRICPVTANDEAAKAQQFHFEFRAADAAANPHLLLAVLIRAGLQGIEEGLAPPPPTEDDLSLADTEHLAQRSIVRLPTTLAGGPQEAR